MGHLTAVQIEAFYEEGYVVIPHLFGTAEVHRMSRAIDDLVRNAAFLPDQRAFVYTPKKLLKRAVWVGGLDHRLRVLGRDPRLTITVAQLFDSRSLVQIINQVHVKWPRDSTFYPLHQDSRNRRYGSVQWKDVNGRGSYVQCLTAVTEATPSNGGLHFIPRSCKKGHLGLAFSEDAETRTDDCHIEDAVPVVLSPGDTVFFGPYTVHGSGKNYSSSRQELFINGFAYPGANRRVYFGCGTGEEISV